MKYTSIIVSLMILFTSFFSGCSSLGDRRSPLAAIAVQYAVAKVVDQNTEKAQRVLSIVSEIRKHLSNEQATTLEALEQIVRDQIDFTKLDSADAVLVNALIEEVRLQLEDRLGEGPLLGDRTLIVAEVLGWVERAAGLLAKQPSNS